MASLDSSPYKGKKPGAFQEKWKISSYRPEASKAGDRRRPDRWRTLLGIEKLSEEIGIYWVRC